VVADRRRDVVPALGDRQGLGVVDAGRHGGLPPREPLLGGREVALDAARRSGRRRSSSRGGQPPRVAQQQRGQPLLQLPLHVRGPFLRARHPPSTIGARRAGHDRRQP
jgi:hypothetical protein